jgi:transposase InsO family protein
MATENGWRARKIQGELSKLGIHLGLTTISRYLPKIDAGGDPHQRWMTFLRNHRDVIAGMEFFVVPTVRFTLLYAWFVLDHGRRRVLHFNVTRYPSARWVIQQLRETFPDQPTHRYLILDNDAIFSAEVFRTIARFGVHPQRTALQSPWQNGTVERFVGTVRRELLDHVVSLGRTTCDDYFGNTSSTTTPIAFTRRSATRQTVARQNGSRGAEPRSSGYRA